MLGEAVWTEFFFLCLVHTSFPLTLGLLAEPTESQAWGRPRELSLQTESSNWT